MDIRYLLSDLIECKGNLQEWINRRYKNPDILQIDLNACDVIPYVMNKKGIIFKLSKNFNTLIEADLDYNYDDLGRDDICIDIGANIGGFAIPASYLCNKVFAVEPITFEELKQNISLNNRNIEVIQKGLGDGSDIIISWGRLEKKLQLYLSLKSKNIVAGVISLNVTVKEQNGLLNRMN